MVAPTDDDSELPLVTRQPLSAEDVRALTQLEHFIERRGFAKSRRRVGIVGEAFAVIALSVTAVALIITLSPHNNRAPTNGGAVQTEAPSQHPPSTPTVLARPAPAPRIRSAMAFDPANQRFVLFGGSAFGGDTGDTWVWSGGAWSQLHPANSPSARDGATLAYDPVTRGLILFGGAGADAPSGQFSDTWELTGMDWKQLSPRSSPPPRAEASMATDSTHNSVILFGLGRRGHAIHLSKRHMGVGWAFVATSLHIWAVSAFRRRSRLRPDEQGCCSVWRRQRQRQFSRHLELGGRKLVAS
jgi:hypothetical protein